MDRQPNNAKHDTILKQPAASLAWLLASAIGQGIAALIVCGVIAAHARLPITGWLLSTAMLLGALPQLSAVIRGGWVVRWHELIATSAAFLGTGVLGLWLAWPTLLPLGASVDGVHHLQLITWIAEHSALPLPDNETRRLLGEMAAYPVGFALLAVAVAWLVGQSSVAVLYPLVAVVGAMIAAVTVLLSAASDGSNEIAICGKRFSPRFLLPRILVLLVGPLLLLAHRTYSLEAYTEQSYYTMVLGVFLVLLASAWMIVAPPSSWSATAQFGIALAALVGTYPLWAPLPAGLSALILAVHQLKQANRGSLARLGLRFLLAWGPALVLGLLDTVPRLNVGMLVLAHQGYVPSPTAERLMPVLLALLCLPLLVRPKPGRHLLVLAGLTGAMLVVLAVAARLNLAALYHSDKVLFVLTPLAAAITGAAMGRLLKLLEMLDEQYRVGSKARPGEITLFASIVPVGIVRPTLVGLAGIILVLALSGSFQIAQPRAIQLLTPDLVAAAHWLRSHDPKAAEEAIVVGGPQDLLGYWVQLGLLNQGRDRGMLNAVPITPESWLVNTNLPSVAIAPTLNSTIPETDVVARVGEAAIIRRAADFDPASLNPLVIRYQAFHEDGRIKTALELQRAQAGPLPLIELLVYYNGTPLTAFRLPPEQERVRPQYLGADLLGTLGGEGYINQSAYPIFAPPATTPTGAYTLTLRLKRGENTLDERLLVTFKRLEGGQFTDVVPSSGELVYLRHMVESPVRSNPQTAIEFGDDIQLVGWNVPKYHAPGNTLAIDLRWQTQRALDRSLFPEVLVLDSNGTIVASSLEAPQGGFYPTWRWLPGEEVVERRTIKLPYDLPSGTYHVDVRVRDFADEHTRSSSGNEQTDEALELGQVVVGEFETQ